MESQLVTAASAEMDPTWPSFKSPAGAGAAGQGSSQWVPDPCHPSAAHPCRRWRCPTLNFSGKEKKVEMGRRRHRVASCNSHELISTQKKHATSKHVEDGHDRREPAEGISAWRCGNPGSFAARAGAHDPESQLNATVGGSRQCSPHCPGHRCHFCPFRVRICRHLRQMGPRFPETRCESPRIICPDSALLAIPLGLSHLSSSWQRKGSNRKKKCWCAST